MNTKKLFIISGPSGAGEDSIIKGLKEKLNITVSITTTTRKMRDGESEGNPYYFITKEEFRKGIKNNEFFEWTEEDAGNLYGITQKEITRLRNDSRVSIWKVDYNGVVAAKKLLSQDVIAIFIKCPLNQLAQRLKLRDNASDEFIERRLKYAKGWLENEGVFDYTVVNSDGKLKESIDAVYNIITANTRIQ